MGIVRLGEGFILRRRLHEEHRISCKQGTARQNHLGSRGASQEGFMVAATVVSFIQRRELEDSLLGLIGEPRKQHEAGSSRRQAAMVEGETCHMLSQRLS